MDDLGPAAWILPRLLGWGRNSGTRVGAVVPTGFEAYARLPHPIQTGLDSWTTWEQVARTAGRTAHARMQWEAIIHQPNGSLLQVDGGPHDVLPPHLAQRLVARLGEHTSRPSTCWFAVWDGYGDLPATDAARLQLPGRTYVLLTGPLEMAALPLWGHGSDPRRSQGPNLWWPADRTWVVGTEIDFVWTYVGGTAACIQSLLDDEQVEAYATDVQDRGDLFGDDINPLPDGILERFGS